MSQAAIKVLDLVAAVARHTSGGIASGEAAALTGLDKTTTSRLLNMLTSRAWLVRDPATRRYYPGPALIEVAYATGYGERVAQGVDELLRSLQENTGETVALYRLAGRVRLCIAGYESKQEVRSTLQTGETRPLSLGAASRAMLAFCAEDLQQQIIDAQPDDAARQLLGEHLRSAVRDGYLSTGSPDGSGSGSVAVPLFDHDRIYGAVGVSGPASRFTEQRRRACLPGLFAVARQASEELTGARSARYSAWDYLPTAASDDG